MIDRVDVVLFDVGFDADIALECPIKQKYRGGQLNPQYSLQIHEIYKS